MEPGVLFRVPYFIRKKGTLIRSLYFPSVCLSIAYIAGIKNAYFDTIKGMKTNRALLVHLDL